jgi:hypothetical protein
MISFFLSHVAAFLEVVVVVVVVVVVIVIVAVPAPGSGSAHSSTTVVEEGISASTASFRRRFDVRDGIAANPQMEILSSNVKIAARMK